MLSAKLYILFTFPHSLSLMPLFHPRIQSRTPFYHHISMVSPSLGQFLRFPWSFMTLIFGMSTGHCFAECLSIWVCQMIRQKVCILGKKIRDTKGTFHVKMGSIKDRNGMDLTEAVDIKKRWQEYTEELYKKDLHDQIITMV